MNAVSSSTHRRYFPRGPGLGLQALALMLVAAALMVADHGGSSLKPLREHLRWALTPLVWVATFPSGVTEAAGEVRTRAALEAENARLRDELLMQRTRLQTFAALEAENHRIRELLASAKNLRERVLIAEIIAINQDPYRHQITLNKGTADGIYRGQALVDAHGILGQVIEVSPHNCTALLISDPDHGIPVEINRTGLQTIAIGRGDGRGLKLPFLPSNADVQEGDLLVSSPLGGRFPAGYPVGQIHQVKHTAGEHFMEAYAHPAARLNQGRQALLVWNPDPLPASDTITEVVPATP